MLHKKFRILYLSLLFILLAFPALSQAKFYKYKTEDGTVVITDDPRQIPPEKRKDLDIVEEEYDDLSPEERAAKREEEERLLREKQARERERFLEQKAREEYINAIEEKLEEQQEAMEERRKARETKVEIRGNHVLVPATLVYKGREVETLLLLDTGASLITMKNSLAEELDVNYVHARRSSAKIASGKQVVYNIITLDSIKVGPVTMEKIEAGIITHIGKNDPFQGLLGMNFLRNVQYSIDFEREVIIWH